MECWHYAWELLERELLFMWLSLTRCVDAKVHLSHPWLLLCSSLVFPFTLAQPEFSLLVWANVPTLTTRGRSLLCLSNRRRCPLALVPHTGRIHLEKYRSVSTKKMLRGPEHQYSYWVFLFFFPECLKRWLLKHRRLRSRYKVLWYWRVVPQPLRLTLVVSSYEGRLSLPFHLPPPIHGTFSLSWNQV